MSENEIIKLKNLRFISNILIYISKIWKNAAIPENLKKQYVETEYNPL